MIGAIALSAHRPTWRWMAVAALPAAWRSQYVQQHQLFGDMAVPVLATWRRCEGRRLALAAAVVAPIALCLLAESVIWHASHDSESRPNLVDRHLFAKALIVEPRLTLSDPELAAILAMGREVFAPARELIAGAPSHYAAHEAARRFRGGGTAIHLLPGVLAGSERGGQPEGTR